MINIDEINAALAACSADIQSVSTGGTISLDAQVRAYDLLSSLLELKDYGGDVSVSDSLSEDFRKIYQSVSDKIDNVVDVEKHKEEARTRIKQFKDDEELARTSAADAKSLHEFAKEVFHIWQTGNFVSRWKALRQLRKRAGFRLERHRIGNYVAKTFDLMNEAQAKYARAQQAVFNADATYKCKPGIYKAIYEALDKKRIIILDFDGTLGDTASVIVQTMQATIKELGLPERTDQECAAMIGLRLVEIPPALFPDSDVDGELYAETYRMLFKIYNTDGAVNLYPNVMDTLKGLHDRGITLTIASSRSRSSLADYVDKLGLSPYIGHFLGADDVKEGKPSAEAVLKTLAKCDFKPSEALVVGDTVFDIQMGKNAGTMTCGVTYGNGSRESLADADWLIDDFADLLKIIDFSL